MDLLDRLLQHDLWTTQQLLQSCRELTAAQRNQPFDVGHQTIDATFRHMIGNVGVWTDLMYERTVRQPAEGPAVAVDELLLEWTEVYADFAMIARQLTDQGRLDDTYVDILDDPPGRKTFGATIAHVITHNMHHRGEIMHMLARLGIPSVIEGDVLSWEHQTQGRDGYAGTTSGDDPRRGD